MKLKSLTRPTWLLGSLLLLAPAVARAESPVNPPEHAYVPRPAGSVTFNKDIAPVIFQNCSSCHRPGEVAPFSLLNYADARKHAKTMASVTQKHLMPPWKADPALAIYHDMRVLSAGQIGLIQQWFADGTPEGRAADLPPPPKFTLGWTLGEPDVVFEPAESYTIEAEGRDVYRCFVIPAKYKEDRYIAAMEVRPGNRAVVHHVIAYLDTTGTARKRDEADPGPGYTSFGGPGFLPQGSLGGWAPGNQPRLLPDGVGVLLPAGADIVLQVHYHKTGKPETDRTKLGLYFAKGEVTKRQRTFPVAYRQLKIPPGEANYTVSATLPIPWDVTLTQIMPHMHLIGREMTVTATLPDGTEKPLVHIPDWDFNWQMSYRFQEPVKLPRGSRVHLTARFDNSADNPRNPSHPPRLVTRGEGTTDEMCMAFLNYTIDAENVAGGKMVRDAPDRF